jgi:hypothetical protein
MLHFTSIFTGDPKRRYKMCLQKINHVNNISLWDLCANRERGGDINWILGTNYLVGTRTRYSCFRTRTNGEVM